MHLVANVVPYFLLLLMAGVASGFVNTLASSGSAISLPMLITLGLPALEANATNRLPVLFGSLMALRTFHAARKIDWRVAKKIVLPATLGSAVGGYLAVRFDNRQFGLIIIVALFVALVLLFTNLKEALAGELREPPRITALGLLVLSFVGVWLGFIVLDGAMYLLLVLIGLFGYDLARANALKVFLLVATTLAPIAQFSWAGNIRWTEGLLLSAGSLLGAHFGAKLSTHKEARRWVFRVLVGALVLELIHLTTHYF